MPLTQQLLPPRTACISWLDPAEIANRTQQMPRFICGPRRHACRRGPCSNARRQPAGFIILRAPTTHSVAEARKTPPAGPDAHHESSGPAAVGCAKTRTSTHAKHTHACTHTHTRTHTRANSNTHAQKHTHTDVHVLFLLSLQFCSNFFCVPSSSTSRARSVKNGLPSIGPPSPRPQCTDLAI